MSKSKPTGHIFICLCDYHRPYFKIGNSKIWERPYRGRYVVNAKNKKHALKVLREVCPFGSLQVYYQQDNYPLQPGYGKVIKEA